jgi:hypothetical protein
METIVTGIMTAGGWPEDPAGCRGNVSSGLV